MGLTAITSSAASAAISLLSPVGLGVGGVFIAAALVLLLSSYDLLDAADYDHEGVRTTMLAMIVPLMITFGGIVLFKSLQVV